MASVDGWRRRQPINNQQMLYQQSQQQPRVQPQYQQPQSRAVRQFHNQYYEHLMPQNQIWKTLGQSYNEIPNSETLKFTNKLPQFNTQNLQQTHNMSNAELEDMIVNRSAHSLNFAGDWGAAINFCKQNLNKKEKCFCNNAVQNNLVDKKSASSTTINSSVCDSPPPDTLMSKPKYQMIPLIYDKYFNSSSWSNGNFNVKQDLNGISCNANNSKKNSFVLSALQHQSLIPQPQHQRNLQAGSFEEHYEFYTESDKTSHGNTPSVSSIDDFQQTIPNFSQQYQNDIRRLQNDTYMTKNFLEKSKENLSRTIKRPDSLRFVFNFIKVCLKYFLQF